MSATSRLGVRAQASWPDNLGVRNSQGPFLVPLCTAWQPSFSAAWGQVLAFDPSLGGQGFAWKGVACLPSAPCELTVPSVGPQPTAPSKGVGAVSWGARGLGTAKHPCHGHLAMECAGGHTRRWVVPLMGRARGQLGDDSP